MLAFSDCIKTSVALPVIVKPAGAIALFVDHLCDRTQQHRTSFPDGVVLRSRY